VVLAISGCYAAHGLRPAFVQAPHRKLVWLRGRLCPVPAAHHGGIGVGLAAASLEKEKPAGSEVGISLSCGWQLSRRSCASCRRWPVVALRGRNPTGTETQIDSTHQPKRAGRSNDRSHTRRTGPGHASGLAANIVRVEPEDQIAYNRQRLIEDAGPAITETAARLGIESEEERRILIELCVRVFTTGIRRGASEVVAQLEAQGKKVDLNLHLDE
jgi:hypothetical protein